MKVILNNSKVVMRKSVKSLNYVENANAFNGPEDKFFGASSINLSSRVYDVSDVSTVRIVMPTFPFESSSKYTLYACRNNGNAIDFLTYNPDGEEKEMTFDIDVSVADELIINVSSVGTIPIIVTEQEGIVYTELEGSQVENSYIKADGTAKESSSFRYTEYNVASKGRVVVTAYGTKSNGIPMWVGMKGGVVVSTGTYEPASSTDNFYVTRQTVDVQNIDTLFVNSIAKIPPVVLI